MITFVGKDHVEWFDADSHEQAAEMMRAAEVARDRGQPFLPPSPRRFSDQPGNPDGAPPAV
jgi:hypothetical protein